MPIPNVSSLVFRGGIWSIPIVPTDIHGTIMCRIRIAQCYRKSALLTQNLSAQVMVIVSPVTYQVTGWTVVILLIPVVMFDAIVVLVTMDYLVVILLLTWNPGKCLVKLCVTPWSNRLISRMRVQRC